MILTAACDGRSARWTPRPFHRKAGLQPDGRQKSPVFRALGVFLEGWKANQTNPRTRGEGVVLVRGLLRFAFHPSNLVFGMVDNGNYPFGFV
jgi:hypothetical protein